jgi:Uma2 family endonuclease
MLKEPVMESITDQHAFNRRRWKELCEDPVFAKHDFRVETDRFGQALVMSTPPTFEHGGFQFNIGTEIQKHLPEGFIITECPVSTSEGVKGADVVWISSARKRRALRDGLLELAPEICVEVLSKSNTREEMLEKKRLYFESGAKEVWFCDLTGRMHFYLCTAPDAPSVSALCPKFPRKI